MNYQQTPSSLREAANFLNATAEGKTLAELRQDMRADIERRRRELDVAANALIDLGLAAWEQNGDSPDRLIVRGRSNLLDQERDPAELDRIKHLFDDLERKRDIANFLHLADEGEGPAFCFARGLYVLMVSRFQSKYFYKVLQSVLDEVSVQSNTE